MLSAGLVESFFAGSGWDKGFGALAGKGGVLDEFGCGDIFEENIALDSRVGLLRAIFLSGGN